MKELSRFQNVRLIASVLLFHILFLFFLGWGEKGKIDHLPKPVVVRDYLEKKPRLLTPKTVLIQQPKKENVLSGKSPQTVSSPKSSQFVSTSTATPAKTRPFAGSSKEKEGKSVHKELTSQTLSLIKRLEAELSSLPQESQVPQKKELEIFAIPREIHEIKSLATVESDACEDDQERLISELQYQLRLPEYGEVHCSFLIDEKGTLTDLHFDSYKNKENLEYLKKTLPLLSFPWFNGQTSKEKRFHVTFSNEMAK